MQLDDAAEYSDAASGTILSDNYINGGNLLYGFAPESRAVLVTMKYHGVSGTLVGSVQHGSGFPRVYVYRWIYPPIGSHTLEATYASTQTSRVMRAISFKGANTAEPDGTVVTKVGTAINKSLDVTTTRPGSFIVDCIADTGNVFAAASGQTMIGGTNANRVCSYRSAPTAGAYTNNWTGTSGANVNYAGLIFEVFSNRTPFRKYWHGVSFSAIGQKGTA